MSQIVLQVWTGPRCDSSAEPLGALPSVVAGRFSRAVSGAQSVTLTLSRRVAVDAGVSEGRFLWFASPVFGVSEWVILSVVDGGGAARDTVQLTAGPLSHILTLRGTIRTINTADAPATTFTPPALRVDTLLETYFVPNLAADGLSWITLGAVAYSGTIQIGPIARWTRAQLLDAIRAATGYEWDWVRLGNTGYRLDLVRKVGETAPVVVIETGKNAHSIERTRDLLTGATVVEPTDASGNPMRDTLWRVDGITGSGPYWIKLSDPANGPAVIREDDQVNGWAIVPLDGLPQAITDSRASDSSVEVSDKTGFIVGSLASLWRSTAGNYADSVTSPTGLTARGRVVQPVSVPTPSLYANLLVDPVMRTALGLWEVVSPANGGADVFSRTDTPNATMVINGAVGAAASSITVDGGTPNMPIRFGEPLTVAGTSVAASATVNTDASGGATVAITPVLPTTLAGGTDLLWQRSGATIGTGTTVGTQSAGASSLVLSGLPSTPALTSADTLRYDVLGAGAVLFSGSRVGNFIPSGTNVTVIEERVFSDASGYTYVPVTYESTTTADANPGDAVVNFNTSSQPPFGTGWQLVSQTLRFTVLLTSYTFTLTGAPPAWSTAFQATPTLTAGLPVAIPANAVMGWYRGSTYLGSVRAHSGALSGATTLPLTLTSGFGQVLSGDVFSLPAQTLYSASNMSLSGTGTGTINLRVNTAAAIADNTVITVRRCPEFADTQLGSPTVLRLRGNNTVFPTAYRSATEYALYSPVMRVRSPVGSGGYILNTSVGITRWAAEAGQTQRLWWALWDADTGANITVQGFGTSAPPFSARYESPVHNVSQAFSSLTTERRVRFSLHPGAGQVGDGVGGFTFLRYVALGIATTVGQYPLVDGAGSNALWHRAQDILAASGQARYRVSYAVVQGLTTDADEALTLGGTVRLRDATMGLDVRVRVVGIEQSVTNLDDITLTVQVLTPLLTEASL